MSKKLKPRVIRVVGEINEEAYLSFSRKLAFFENQDKDYEVIVELNSEGGTAHDALGFVGRMRNSPCFISVIAHGLVASAAVIILAYGDKRSMSREAWVMVHEDSGEVDGSTSEKEKVVLHSKRMERQWAYLLALKTTTTYEKWLQLHKDTTFLEAKECLELGLIDEVI